MRFIDFFSGVGGFTRGMELRRIIMGREEYSLKRINGVLYFEHRLIVENVLGRKLSSDEIVHHKDGNKRNNDLDNLEVITRAEHAKMHANSLDKSRPVLQIKDGIIVNRYSSARNASREVKGTTYQNIYKCCRGIRKTCGGFMWEYAE